MGSRVDARELRWGKDEVKFTEENVIFCVECLVCASMCLPRCVSVWVYEYVHVNPVCVCVCDY